MACNSWNVLKSYRQIRLMHLCQYLLERATLWNASATRRLLRLVRFRFSARLAGENTFCVGSFVFVPTLLTPDEMHLPFRDYFVVVTGCCNSYTAGEYILNIQASALPGRLLLEEISTAPSSKEWTGLFLAALIHLVLMLSW
jgi:hypothetical protein